MQVSSTRRQLHKNGLSWLNNSDQIKNLCCRSLPVFSAFSVSCFQSVFSSRYLSEFKTTTAATHRYLELQQEPRSCSTTPWTNAVYKWEIEGYLPGQLHKWSMDLLKPWISYLVPRPNLVDNRPCNQNTKQQKPGSAKIKGGRTRAFSAQLTWSTEGSSINCDEFTLCNKFSCIQAKSSRNTNNTAEWYKQ